MYYGGIIGGLYGISDGMPTSSKNKRKTKDDHINWEVHSGNELRMKTTLQKYIYYNLVQTRKIAFFVAFVFEFC